MKPLLIVDVEATCWEGRTPPGQQNEIIEIGICQLDLESLEISRARGILVKPQRSKVSEFCTQLTTLTQEQVDGGLLFDEACKVLETEYASMEYPWGSWGSYDMRMFTDQCPSFGVTYPFSSQHINLKKRFAAAFGLSRPMGMAGALRYLNLELIGTHHRGEDDAPNIARIVQTLIKTYGESALYQQDEVRFD
jgi:inhibitor of KinA sporulation pathway (predicted exonuclease)